MNKFVIRGIFIAAFIIAGVAVASAQRPILGGYKTISVSDENAVAAADFAVGKEEETTEGITLDSILKAEYQVVAGTNYRLCLKVKLDNETQDVEVIVFRDLKDVFTLRSWTPKECGGE